jgi:hypothetical protein
VRLAGARSQNGPRAAAFFFFSFLSRLVTPGASGRRRQRALLAPHPRTTTSQGKGKGKEGRASGDVHDLSEITRPELHAGRPTSGSSAGSSGAAAAAAAKAAPPNVVKAVTVMVYANGDSKHDGISLVIGKEVNSWEKLLDKLTDKLKLPTGHVRKVFQVVHDLGGNTHKKITSLEALADGMVLLGCGPEDLNTAKYPVKLGKPKV